MPLSEVQEIYRQHDTYFFIEHISEDLGPNFMPYDYWMCKIQLPDGREYKFELDPTKGEVLFTPNPAYLYHIEVYTVLRDKDAVREFKFGEEEEG